MSKKVLSVVLALVLIMSTFVTVAFAVSYENTKDASKNTQVWSLSEPTKVNETTYTVDVNLKTNYATGVIEFVIVEDDANGAIALTDVTLGAGVPATYKAELSKNLSKGHVYIVPQTEEGTEIVTATAIDGVVATLTYSYTGTGSGTIAISNDPKTAENKGGTLIAARMGSNNIVDEDMIVGQTVVDANGVAIEDETITPVTIGAAAEPNTLVILNEAVKFSDAYCNQAHNGILCGFAKFNTAAYLTTDLTTTLGKEYLNVVVNSANKTSTGAIIQVLDADKTTVLESYVVVIFGDLDGNGRFQGADIQAGAKALTAINSNIQSPLKVAANCDGDARMRVQGSDMKALAKAVTAYGSKQVELAEKLF